MVNSNELKIVKKYESEGWKTVRGGWPDFVFIKVNNGDITDIKFVEVKTPSDPLSYEQQVIKKIIMTLGGNYTVELVPNHTKPIHHIPNQTNPSQTTTPHPTPVQSRPGQPKPHHPRPSHPRPGHPSPIQPTPFQAKPVLPKPFQKGGDV